MAETTVVTAQIDTQSSIKSLRELRTELKGYREQVLSLEEGTEEYNTAVQKAAGLTKQFREASEQIRFSQQDWDQTLGQLTQSAAGLVGAFNAVRGVVSLFAEDNEVLVETFVKIQAGMSIVQGLQAMAAGVEAAKDAWTALRASIGASLGPIGLVTAAIGAITVALVSLANAESEERFQNSQQRKERDSFNSSLKTTNSEYEYQIRLLKALGAPVQDIINKTIEQNQAELQALATRRAQLQVEAEWIKSQTNQYTRTLAQKAIIEELVAIEERYPKLLQERITLEEDLTIQREVQNQKAIEGANKIAEANRDIVSSINEIKEALSEEDERWIQYWSYINGLDTPKIETTPLYDALVKDLELSDNYLQKELKRQADIQIKNDKLIADTKVNISKQTLSALINIAGQESDAGKAAAVALATIDTYQAANSSYKSLSGIPIVGPALGAAAAAAAIIAGLANVKQILSVDTEGKGSGTTTSYVPTYTAPTLPDITQPITETHNLYDGYDTELLNRSQTVLVVEDYEEVADRRRVAVSESRI